jgi:hypothetical protein
LSFTTGHWENRLKNSHCIKTKYDRFSQTFLKRQDLIALFIFTNLPWRKSFCEFIENSMEKNHEKNPSNVYEKFHGVPWNSHGIP